MLQELKILPKNFENALNSCDRSVSSVYQQWREKDFPDWYTMGELEQAFQVDKHNNSDKEWLQIFPEAEEYLISRLVEKQMEYKNLRIEIKRDLLRIYKTVKNELSVEFYEGVLEFFKGKKLNQLSKEIRKIKWALNQEKEMGGENRISDDMIQRARDYPLDQLIEFNRARKALCVFHNEKNPSMSLNPKTNRIKCFACGINLDPIGYVMETQKISFIDAVKYLQ